MSRCPIPINPTVIYVIEHSEWAEPEYNPRHLPVPSSNDPFIRSIFDLSQWFSTNEDGWFNGGDQ